MKFNLTLFLISDIQCRSSPALPLGVTPLWLIQSRRKPVLSAPLEHLPEVHYYEPGRYLSSAEGTVLLQHINNHNHRRHQLRAGKEVFQVFGFGFQRHLRTGKTTNHTTNS